MSPNPPVEDRAPREAQREIDRSQRLQERIHRQLLELAAGTHLYHGHPELGVPQSYVVVMGHFVQTNITINPDKIRLLPTTGKANMLREFANELEPGFRHVGDQNHLEYGVGPGEGVQAGPILDGLATQYPIGWHVYFRRLD